MIAVDSSPKCLVRTLRVDLAVKKVSLSSTLKGETRLLMMATTFLTDGKTK